MRDSSYGQHDREREQMRNENEAYLAEFENYLVDQGLSEKTIERHLRDAAFFLNDYLLRGKPCGASEGCYAVGGFLGRFLVRECAWSTPEIIMQYAESIKEFYRCMASLGYVEPSDSRAHRRLLPMLTARRPKPNRVPHGKR